MKFKNNKNITPALHTYIESQILPQYSAFDPAHQRNHVDAVIRESMHLATHFEIDANMVYTIAAYHDLGIGTDRKTHHLISGNIIRQDIELSKWFNKEQIETMAQAVEDHRASNKSEPRSVYGNLLPKPTDNLIHEPLSNVLFYTDGHTTRNLKNRLNWNEPASTFKKSTEKVDTLNFGFHSQKINNV